MIRDIMEKVVGWYREFVPYTPPPGKRLDNGKFRRPSTGNMRFNATKAAIYQQTSNEKGEVYVDDVIAPYVYYTNEPWISPKWHGAKNPNEGWAERAFDSIAERLAQDLGGEISEE